MCNPAGSSNNFSNAEPHEVTPFVMFALLVRSLRLRNESASSSIDYEYKNKNSGMVSRLGKKKVEKYTFE